MAMKQLLKALMPHYRAACKTDAKESSVEIKSVVRFIVMSVKSYFLFLGRCAPLSPHWVYCFFQRRFFSLTELISVLARGFNQVITHHATKTNASKRFQEK